MIKRIFAEIGEVKTLLFATVLATAASLFVQEAANLRDESLFILVAAAAVILVGLTAKSFGKQLELIHERIDSVGPIDWTYENEEHEVAVYRKMTDLVRDPDVAYFYVLSVFKPLEQRGLIDEPTHQALSNYYRALEERAREDGFTYRRAAILRSRIKNAVEQDHLLCDLVVERPSFVEHYNNLAFLEENAPTLKFFRDEGRMLDVAFGLALDDRRRPISLVIELGVTSTETNITDSDAPPRRALGLLSFPHPTPRLAGPFQKVHEDVWAGRILDRIPTELVRSRLTESVR